MKIGVWLNEPMNKNSGGVFTYIDTLIRGIDNFNFNSAVEIVFLSEHPQANLNKPIINISEYQKGIAVALKIVRKILKIISRQVFGHLINLIDQKEKRIKDTSVAGYLKKECVKLIFYPMQQNANVINGIPFIINNWDLAHYTTYPFPEITGGEDFHNRNSWYVNVLPEALMVFCETNAGKKEIAHYLNYNPDKIKVLPIFASNQLNKINLAYGQQTDILKNLGVQQQKFFFYPAQFWAHKNHYTLIKAFQKFLLQYPDFKLLFCGSDKGNLAYLQTCVKTLGLDNNIIFAGFVDDDQLFALYKNATALIMPTFLGPSNIPPIEALFLDCPILCSGLEGHKEMLQDAALYFDPLNNGSIVESMIAITGNSVRLNILQKQKKLTLETDHTIEKALLKLEAHLMEAINIRNCWE